MRVSFQRLSLAVLIVAQASCEKETSEAESLPAKAAAASQELLESELGELRHENQQLKDEIERLKAKQPNSPKPISGPDPQVRYSISIDNMPFEGGADAPVVLVKVTEFACPFCERSQQFTDAVLQAFPGQVKVVHKDFIVHRTRAFDQAFGACAANRQGQWKAMANLLWEESFKAKKFDQAHIESLAQKLNLDMNQYRTDRDGVCRDIVRKAHAEVAGLGVRGTPSFFINGKLLQSRTVAAARPFIEDELKAFSASGIANGPTFYEQRVMANGQKPKPMPLPPAPP